MFEKATIAGKISILPTSINMMSRNFGMKGKFGVNIFGESPVVVIADALSTRASTKL